MIFYTFLFFFSLVGIVIILANKLLEIEKGKSIIPLKLKNVAEIKIAKSALLVSKKINSFTANKLRKIIIKTILFFYRTIARFINKTLEKIRNEDIKLIRIVKGEKLLNRNGEASSFLRDVSEFKKENLRNRSEDDLTDEKKDLL